MFVAITIIAQNLQIRGVSIKTINNTTLTIANQRVIYPLMLGEEFCLFINPFASLRCWRNTFMSKPKTLKNCLTGWFGIGAQSNSCRIRCVICWCLWCHFPLNNSEKAALDIMELLKIDLGYYMTKCCRSVNMRRKLSSIYSMSEPQKIRRKVLCHSKKISKTKALKLKEPHVKSGAFKIQY